MNNCLRLPALLVLLVLARPAPGLMAQSREAATVQAASNVLAEIMQIPARSIPHAMLSNAQGIVIIPGMIKGGFVIGVRHGSGVILARDEAGNWAPPTFCTMTGASIGWQIGIQGTDVILVFVTNNGLQSLLKSKITLGADISAAAGPVGREAAVATDAGLKAEIYSYSRSRGLFAGASLDGSALRVDTAATAVYYQAVNPQGMDPRQAVPLPPEAARLLAQLAGYTNRAVPVPSAATPVPVMRPAPDGDALRRQLADSVGQLSAIIDQPWKDYLALPTDLAATGRSANVDSLRLSLSRFDAVAASPAYGPLTSRPEFQSTRDLLRRYLAAQPMPPASPPLLPAPPR